HQKVVVYEEIKNTTDKKTLNDFASQLLEYAPYLPIIDKDSILFGFAETQDHRWAENWTFLIVKDQGEYYCSYTSNTTHLENCGIQMTHDHYDSVSMELFRHFDGYRWSISETDVEKIIEESDIKNYI